MMMICKRILKLWFGVVAVLGIGTMLANSAVAQQTYPSKPIRFIVPYPPGGASDPLARLVGQKLTDSWGQPVIIDNRGGGNGVIANEALVKSPADGHTIMLESANHAINPLLFPDQPYDTIKDFAPVATLVSTQYVLVLHPSIPANNLQEFIALAKSKPGQLNGGGSNTGGIQHLALELFNALAGVKLQNIPYKGGGQSTIDLVAGRVQLSFNNPISLMPLIKSGKVKAIAVGGESRMSTLPDVPTFTEAGVPGFTAKNWFGLVVPASTPRDIIGKLADEVNRMQATPDFRESLSSQGGEPFTSTPAQFAALIKADLARYARIIKEANIKVEN